jgi:hypothetical protein
MFMLCFQPGRPEFEVAAMQFWQHLHHMGTAGGFFCESMDVSEGWAVMEV